MSFRSEDPPRNDSHRRLESSLGHRFADRGLLEAALTHRSYANEQGLEVNYERLEFLGDAVLALASADWLYRVHPQASEGELSKLKSFLVSEPVLARIAEDLELGPLMQLGVGEERSGGRAKPSLLADAFEAVIGALYIDGGLAPARRLIERQMEQAHDKRKEWRYRDAKSALQETLQARGRPLPRYVLTASEGPDHEKRFTVECCVGGSVLSTGEGRSKKYAEQAAAEAALRELDSGGPWMPDETEENQ